MLWNARDASPCSEASLMALAGDRQGDRPGDTAAAAGAVAAATCRCMQGPCGASLWFRLGLGRAKSLEGLSFAKVAVAEAAEAAAASLMDEPGVVVLLRGLLAVLLVADV